VATEIAQLSMTIATIPMPVSFLIQGIVIGFSIAAPVGPIGVLCMRRTLAEGAICGFVSGLGAASADAVYGSIAGLGLTVVSGLLIAQHLWIRLLGGLFLCWLGARTFLSAPSDGSTIPTERSLIGAFASTFILTLTNPMTILSFGAVFAGLGIGDAQGDYIAAAFLVLGVFLGSALWWLTLSGTVGLVRSRLNRGALQWVNRISGVIIGGFGVVAIASLWSV
jgi:threonine/homoserine/homoserine lactone efflux protein